MSQLCENCEDISKMTRQEYEEFLARIASDWKDYTYGTVAGANPQQPPSSGKPKRRWTLLRMQNDERKTI